MQTVPGQATADRRMSKQAPGHLDAAAFVPLTPAERIALTMARLNYVLDLVDGVARACLAGRRGGSGSSRPRAGAPPSAPPTNVLGKWPV